MYDIIEHCLILSSLLCYFNHSNATAELMDEEVKKIVDEAYRRTIQLMEDKKEQVILIAELLLVKETITNNDVAELIGKRPYKQSEEYEQYASSGWGEEANKIVIDPRDAHPGKTSYSLSTFLL